MVSTADAVMTQNNILFIFNITEEEIHIRNSGSSGLLTRLVVNVHGQIDEITNDWAPASVFTLK